MSDEKTCQPAPCPQFTEVVFSDMKRVGWRGVDLPLMEPDPEFLKDDHEQQVANIVDAIHQMAQEVRVRYKYDDDTIVQVRLPHRSTLSHLFPEVIAAADKRIHFID